MAQRTSCQVCGSKSLTPIAEIENSSVFSSLMSKKQGQDTDHPFSHFVLCDPTLDAKACGLLQNAECTPVSFNNHEPSATYRTNRNHLRDAATEALEMISGRDCAALDIGCNDGSLLSFYPRWVDRFGVDPDPIVDAIGDWAWAAQSDFPSDTVEEAFGTKQFDIITCIGVLEYARDPASLLSAMRNRLTHDGICVLETLYAPLILTCNGVDLVGHDTVGLYSLQVLERLIRELDMKIVRGAVTNKDGGSIRLFITHTANNSFDFDPWSERLARLWDEETVLALRDRTPYQALLSRLPDQQRCFDSLLLDIDSRGDRVALLGTDVHAERIFAWAGRGAKAITHVVDFSEDSRFTPFACPVISQTECRDIQPEYLLAPTARKQEMLEIWRESILSGAKMIFVTPTPHIIDASNYSAEFGKLLSQGDSAAGVETLRAILHAAGGPRLIAENHGERAAS